MLSSEHGDHVRANLVGRIAVSRDAIGADDDAINLALLHDVPGHVVRNHGDWNVVLREFPSRQSRALEKRSRLISIDVDLFPVLNRGADHTQRGAIPGRG